MGNKIGFVVLIMFLLNACTTKKISGKYYLNYMPSHKITIDEQKMKYSYFINDKLMNEDSIKINGRMIYFYSFIFYENCRGNIGDTFTLAIKHGNGRLPMSPEWGGCYFEQRN
jgi:hypothetical protein